MKYLLIVFFFLCSFTGIGNVKTPISNSTRPYDFRELFEQPEEEVEQPCYILTLQAVEGGGYVLAYTPYEFSLSSTFLNFRFHENFNRVVYAYNAVGSVVANTDQDGYTIRENDFDAYGNSTRTDDFVTGNFPTEFGGSQNDLLFSTKERDFSIGLDCHGFRYYDPVLGKYSTLDPIQDGLNHYVYVENNPINKIDPLGLVGDDINIDESGLVKFEDANLLRGNDEYIIGLLYYNAEEEQFYVATNLIVFDAKTGKATNKRYHISLKALDGIAEGMGDPDGYDEIQAEIREQGFVYTDEFDIENDEFKKTTALGMLREVNPNESASGRAAARNMIRGIKGQLIEQALYTGSGKFFSSILRNSAKFSKSRHIRTMDALDMGSYPGAKQKFTKQEYRSFINKMNELGYNVKNNGNLKTKGETSLGSKTVTINPKIADKQTLIDEFSHVWNNVKGRGQNLNKFEKGMHNYVGNKAVKNGTKNLSPLENISFHQLELKNFLNSGEKLPKFFQGITEKEFKAFVGGD